MFVEGDHVYLNHMFGGPLSELRPAVVTSVMTPASFFRYRVESNGHQQYAREDWLINQDIVIEEAFG